MSNLRVLLTASTIALASAALPHAQQGEDPQPSGPWWAYGFLAAPKPGEAAPDCGVPTPVTCAIQRPAPQVDETPRSLPGAPRQFSRKQASEWFGPADWYPNDHPPMPDIVARGNEARGIRACTLCHHPLGKGRPENAGLAGLPAAYFVQQIAEFKNGTRRSADPRKLNTKEMIAMAKALTDAEVRAVAEYFASVTWSPRGTVVETETVPNFVIRGGMYLPEGTGTVPLGRRIIEMPENPDEAEYLRDPKARWRIHAPIGSIAKGKALVTTGTAVGPDGKPVPGRTLQCTACHGPALNGVGNVPALAGRSPSYIVRQLYDMQAGTRASPLMKPVVAGLTDDDFVAIGAYLASLP